MQTDIMRSNAQLAKENLTWLLIQMTKRKALQTHIQSYHPLTDALAKVCLWIVQYDKATVEQRGSPEMFEAWYVMDCFATQMFDESFDHLNAVRNRALDLFYEEMMRPADTDSEAA